MRKLIEEYILTAQKLEIRAEELKNEMKIPTTEENFKLLQARREVLLEEIKELRHTADELCEYLPEYKDREPISKTKAAV